MSMLDAPRLIWTDIETFGLDPEKDPIIEVGFVITTPELVIIDTYKDLLWTPQSEAKLSSMEKAVRDGNSLDGDRQFIFDMHTKSELWADARFGGNSEEDATEALVEWLDDHQVNKTEPLCGSSVQFDRSMFDCQMPNVTDFFSYRNIDISTLKELCKRLNPQMYAGLEVDVVPQKRHRVMDDLDDTLAEAAWYFDNFLWLASVDA